MITNQDNIPDKTLSLARRIMQLAEPRKTVTITLTNTGNDITIDVVRCNSVEVLQKTKQHNTTRYNWGKISSKYIWVYVEFGKLRGSEKLPTMLENGFYEGELLSNNYDNMFDGMMILPIEDMLTKTDWRDTLEKRPS